MTPCGHQHRVPEWDGAVLLFDQCLEYVIRFPVERDGRVGGRVYIDFVKIIFAAADQLGQLMSRKWPFNQVVLEAMRARI